MFLMPHFLPPWRLLVVVLTPLLLLPLALISIEARCGYVILVMAIYWMTEALPIPVTALIPVFAFPLLGILSTGEICLVYMKETNMMFLGGLTVAIAVEHCNLHKRVALFVILRVGQSPRRLMTGFMVTTMFLSMWISNTATTAMMVPIVDAILQELYKTRKIGTAARQTEEDPRISPHKQSRDPIAGSDPSQLSYAQSEKYGNGSSYSVSSKSSSTTYEDVAKRPADDVQDDTSDETVLFAPPPDELCARLRDMCYLATAYSANLGGTGAITGTGPNLVLKSVMDRSFPGTNVINFATWLAYNVPGMLLCGACAWIWLHILFLGCRREVLLSNKDREAEVKSMLKKKYRALGRVNFHEAVVLTLFISLVLLWLFRAPGFMTGWGDLFERFFPGIEIDDATPVMMIVLLLFIIPRKPWWRSTNRQLPNGVDRQAVEGDERRYERCLTWEAVRDKLPWGIVLLLGGGFAMAKAADESNMSRVIGDQMRALSIMPKEAIVFIITLVTAMLTEAASNTATASILMPVLKELSVSIHVHPVYMMMPPAISCSYAFMLPVATPPNAIVFGAANMKAVTMLKAGLVMNVICVLVATFMINTLGVVMFDLNHFPDWASANATNFTQ